MEKGKRDKIVLGTLVAAIHNKKILLIERSKEPYKGFWSLPGGKIEFGEHPEETAKRELFEETGIKGDVEAVRGMVNEIVYEAGKPEQHFILFVIQIKPDKTDFTETDEGRLKWAGIKEIEDMKMIPSDRMMVKEFVLGKKEMKVTRVKVKKEGELYDVEEFS